MSTEEDVGYRDAIRQVQRSITRRLKALEQQSKEAGTPEAKLELAARIKELHHLAEVVDSLHR